jgi:hypothetical protein
MKRKSGVGLMLECSDNSPDRKKRRRAVRKPIKRQKPCKLNLWH